ncbi:MAG: hypothetical protein ACXWLH_04975 [Candidatus Saccharimonadales bacterium]
MSRLAELGIGSGLDEQHIKSVNQLFIPPDDFASNAAELLDQLGPIVIEDVVPDLESHFGRWNPGGFMVFPLGMHSLGSLRLHVWPKNEPRETNDGPSIHSHAWHLSSLILNGLYADTLFDLEVLQDYQPKSGEDPLPRLYRSQLKADGRDVLVTDGEHVRPIPISDREYVAGEKHFIPAGVPHLPRIPAGQTTATLVIDSPAFAETTQVLLYPHMEHSNNQVARSRRLVDQAAATAVKAQLLS